MYKNCKGVVNRMMSSSGKRTRSLTSSRCAFVPNKEIIGQTVLITGAKGGIGLDMARQLLKKNNVVIVASRCVDRLNKSCHQVYVDSKPVKFVIVFFSYLEAPLHSLISSRSRTVLRNTCKRWIKIVNHAVAAFCERNSMYPRRIAFPNGRTR